MDIGDVQAGARHALEQRHQHHRQQRQGDDELQPLAQRPTGETVVQQITWRVF
jgi:hypothetical protein